MPTAMLFVPSIGGVSHSFDEHTHDEDIAVGAVAYVGARSVRGRIVVNTDYVSLYRSRRNFAVKF